MLWIASLATLGAADLLQVNLRERTVTADVDGWTLDRTLSHLAARTGWQVFTEPGIALPRGVSERFQDVPVGRALGRLLSGINFTLRPQVNGREQLLIFRTAAGKATQALPDKSPRVKNQLVVMLKPGAGETIEEIAANLGAKVIARIKGMNAYLLEFPYDNAMFLGRDALLRNDQVAGVDFNYRSDPLPRVNGARSAAERFSIKAKDLPPTDRLLVGLIDTRVQSGTPYDGLVVKRLSVAAGSAPDSELPLHGTSMLGAFALGLNDFHKGEGETSVGVISVDVYGDQPTTTAFHMAEGIASAVANGARMLVISSGSPTDSDILRMTVRGAADAGVMIFASAGNDGSANPMFPAAYSESTSVTAVDATGALPAYANTSPTVDVAGPSQVIADWNSERFIVTGTSPANANIGGLAAGMKESTGASNEAIDATLRRVATPPRSP